MQACFYSTPRSDIFSSRKVERFRFLDEINLMYKIDKTVIDDVLKHILMNNCNVSVVGYNINTDKYWCKIYKNRTCELDLEIYVKGLYFDASELNITLLTGETKVIKKFIESLDKGLQLFQTSSFIKLCKSTDNLSLSS